MRKIYIATPCYGGWISYVYIQSFINTLMACAEKGIGVMFQFLGNDSLIPRARNIMVDSFLKTDATHLLFADADIQWKAADLIKMIDCDLDLIGGCTPKKEINWDKVKKMAQKDVPIEQLKWAAKSIVIKMKEGNTAVNTEKPLEVNFIGSSLILIKRRVFEKLADKVKTYISDTTDVNGHLELGIKMKEFFSVCVDNNETLLSEDYFLCQMWRDAGGKVYAAPWAVTDHMGSHLF